MKKRKSTEGLKAVKVKAEVEEETPKKKKKSKRIKTED